MVQVIAQTRIWTNLATNDSLKKSSAQLPSLEKIDAKPTHTIQQLCGKIQTNSTFPCSFKLHSLETYCVSMLTIYFHRNERQCPSLLVFYI